MGTAAHQVVGILAIRRQLILGTATPQVAMIPPEGSPPKRLNTSSTSLM